jgi:hypothetical protein
VVPRREEPQRSLPTCLTRSKAARRPRCRPNRRTSSLCPAPVDPSVRTTTSAARRRVDGRKPIGVSNAYSSPPASTQRSPLVTPDDGAISPPRSRSWATHDDGSRASSTLEMKRFPVSLRRGALLRAPANSRFGRAFLAQARGTARLLRDEEPSRRRRTRGVAFGQRESSDASRNRALPCRSL